MMCVLLYQKVANNRSVSLKKINTIKVKKEHKAKPYKNTKKDMRQSYQLKSATSSLKIYPRLRRRSRPFAFSYEDNLLDYRFKKPCS